MKRPVLLFYAVLLLLLAATVIGTAATRKTNYHLIKIYKVGGEGGWDYLTVDSAARRLYISRGSHFLVLDIDDGKQLGDITGLSGVHGIALAPDLGKGFISNGRGNNVSVIDLKTLSKTTDVPAGENPDAIIYDPASNRVFAFNGRSKNATVIDAGSNAVVSTIDLGGKPEFAVSDGQGTVFVNLEDSGELAAIDAKAASVKSRWKMKGCESPSGLAMDRKSRRVFSACDDTKVIAVVNADSGDTVTTLPIGAGVDAAAFDPSDGLVFASNGGDGTMSIYHEDSPGKYTLAQTLKTEHGARTMALDEKTHNAITVTADFGPPPAATATQPLPRPSIKPDSFRVLVYGKK